MFWRQKDFRHQRKVFGKICFSRKKTLNFPMFLTNEKYSISNLSKTWENLRPVFSTKKKVQNHGKKQGMWKYNKFVEESLTMIYFDYSRWLNVGRWFKVLLKCRQWWHVKIRWWVIQILRNWWYRNIDLFPKLKWGRFPRKISFEFLG